MKRPDADEISRWLKDDTLVAQAMIDGKWVEVSTSPVNWKVVRTSIATVEGKPVFEGDTYYREGKMFTIERADYGRSYIWWWNDCTLTPPKPKSILDSDELHNLLVDMVRPSRGIAGGFTINSAKLKKFLRDHKDEI